MFASEYPRTSTFDGRAELMQCFRRRHILSNTGRVASRDSSRSTATLLDFYTALCEDDTIYGLFKIMKGGSRNLPLELLIVRATKLNLPCLRIESFRLIDVYCNRGIRVFRPSANARRPPVGWRPMLVPFLRTQYTARLRLSARRQATSRSEKSRSHAASAITRVAILVRIRLTVEM